MHLDGLLLCPAPKTCINETLHLINLVMTAHYVMKINTTDVYKPVHNMQLAHYQYVMQVCVPHVVLCVVVCSQCGHIPALLYTTSADSKLPCAMFVCVCVCVCVCFFYACT